MNIVKADVVRVANRTVHNLVLEDMAFKKGKMILSPLRFSFSRQPFRCGFHSLFLFGPACGSILITCSNEAGDLLRSLQSKKPKERQFIQCFSEQLQREGV